MQSWLRRLLTLESDVHPDTYQVVVLNTYDTKVEALDVAIHKGRLLKGLKGTSL
ncbi:hypothetical protein LOSG293_090110 [Secundilactobacillus oryzae JCM 18671]|uniref:Uncharacterized protein n=1 Tax=Secundilactobacillus oryzae JCM 18671 TaxID=1291743 RepID=A0A081BHR8_9LACO|nr:hypothetical protein LOSG293_090110 [Secundilactobacillus oryzae JCM 18671]